MTIRNLGLLFTLTGLAACAPPDATRKANSDGVVSLAFNEFHDRQLSNGGAEYFRFTTRADTKVRIYTYLPAASTLKVEPDQAPAGFTILCTQYQAFPGDQYCDTSAVNAGTTYRVKVYAPNGLATPYVIVATETGGERAEGSVALPVALTLSSPHLGRIGGGEDPLASVSYFRFTTDATHTLYRVAISDAVPDLDSAAIKLCGLADCSGTSEILPLLNTDYALNRSTTYYLTVQNHLSLWYHRYKIKIEPH